MRLQVFTASLTKQPDILLIGVVHLVPPGEGAGRSEEALPILLLHPSIPHAPASQPEAGTVFLLLKEPVVGMKCDEVC